MQRLQRVQQILSDKRATVLYLHHIGHIAGTKHAALSAGAKAMIGGGLALGVPAAGITALSEWGRARSGYKWQRKPSWGRVARNAAIFGGIGVGAGRLGTLPPQHVEALKTWAGNKAAPYQAVLKNIKSNVDAISNKS